MMKQTIYNLFVLCLILCTTTRLEAQDVVCERNFEVKAKITASTCMANGTIEVTLEGDLSNLDMTKAEYGLEPASGTEGTSLLPSTNSILKGIAPGFYTIYVRTFCQMGDQFGNVKELLNVKVEGSYKPLMADLDQGRSRKSYKECATGIIAFNIISNTGYGDLKFYFTKAPSGIALDEIFPTAAPSGVGFTPYTLPGMYPPGQYQIDIKDGCGLSTLAFTIGEITDLPSPSTLNSSFTPPYSYYYQTCNDVSWSASAPSYITAPDHYRYYMDKMYEVALVPKGQIPSASDWEIWYGNTIFTLPDVYNVYFSTSASANTLDHHFRVKDCNQHAKSTPTYLLPPRTYLEYSGGSPTYYCDGYTASIGFYTDRDGFWCYPISVKIVDTEGTVVYNKTHSKQQNVVPDARYKYDTTYELLVKDAASTTNSYDPNNYNPFKFSFNPTVSLFLNTYNCSTFEGTLNITYSNMCFPAIVEVFKLKDGGHSGKPEDYVTYTSYTLNTYSQAITWDYGYYKVVTTFPNHLMSDGKPYTYTSTNNMVANRPTAYTLSTYNPNSCREDEAALYIRSSSPSSSARFPQGTTFTVVEAPDGYAYKGKTESGTSSSYYFTFPVTHMPVGKYKVEVNDGCGVPVFVEATLNGVYSARNTRFVVERDGCEGERLKLEGLVTYAGTANSSYTYYQIISGPAGCDQTLKSYGQSVLLAADGDYVVGIKTSTSANCYLKRETIKFVKSKPTLKPSTTSAYVCTDRQVGYIIVSGQNGTEPYTYDLLNEDKTPTGATPTPTGDGRVYFDYGTAGQTFFVRITDDCGNQNDQEVKLTDLKTQRIIYNTPPSGEYCVGETIMLNCITLGETTYRWVGPNGFVSTDQNPRIQPATVDMTGYYSVSVMPEFCGEKVTDELYIKVLPELVPGTVSSNQEICVATHPATMSATVTGGKGTLKYQWLERRSDRSEWTRLSGATKAMYTPPIASQGGTYYYRLEITDDCKTVLSDIITVNVKPCHIFINPHLRTKTSK